MQAKKTLQTQRSLKKSPASEKGLTLIGLMVILMVAGILGTLAVHVLRHYTLH